MGLCSVGRRESMDPSIDKFICTRIPDVGKTSVKSGGKVARELPRALGLSL